MIRIQARGRQPNPFEHPPRRPAAAGLCLSCGRGDRPGAGPFGDRPARSLSPERTRGSQPRQETFARPVDLVVGRPRRLLLAIGGHERLRNHAYTLGRLPSAHPNSPVSAGETLGVDLGGTKMLMGVLDPELEGSLGEPGDLNRPQPGAAGRPLGDRDRRGARGAAAAAGGRTRHAGDDRSQPAGSRSPRSTCRSHELAIRELASERCGLPVALDNDANVAALAEHLYGAARGARSAVVLTIGTGIGGGLILDGEVYRGAQRRRRRAGPHDDRDRRAAVPGKLPRARLRGDAGLGHRAGARGPRWRRQREPDRRWGGCGCGSQASTGWR